MLLNDRAQKWLMIIHAKPQKTIYYLLFLP